MESEILTVDSSPELTVIVALRNHLVRLGLERLLESLETVQVRTSRDGIATLSDTLEHCLSTEPVVILSLDDVAELVGDAPATKTLVLVDDAQLNQVRQLAGTPVHGFLLTSLLNENTLHNALRQIDAGEVPIPAPLVHALLRIDEERGSTSTPGTIRFTPREQQVLTLLVEGLSNKQLARRLGISVHGAKRHVATILAKLGCSNRTTAVFRALSEGLVPDLAARTPA